MAEGSDVFSSRTRVADVQTSGGVPVPEVECWSRRSRMRRQRSTSLRMRVASSRGRARPCLASESASSWEATAMVPSGEPNSCATPAARVASALN